MFLLRLLPVTAVCISLFAATPYQTEIERWREKTESELKADDGWLAVAGLFWLKEGDNTVGSDPSNNIVLPRGPAKAGVFEFHNGATSFRSADGKVTDATNVKLAGMTMFVIHRGSRYGIRLKDPESRMREEFTGLHWYPAKEQYRVVAKFVPYSPPKQIPIPNVLGETSNQESPGYVVFTLNGQEMRLEPIVEDKELFFIFHDLTAGHETYPPGRFLKAEQAKEGRVILDFNKAYNPPCAFTPYATCPLPPKSNRLPVRIEAGELNYKHP
jgi:uncharacterized protein (DUF1684 family)